MPVDAIEALVCGASDPSLNGFQGDVKASRDGPQGKSLTMELNDLTPPAKRVVFWPREPREEDGLGRFYRAGERKKTPRPSRTKCRLSDSQALALK